MNMGTLSASLLLPLADELQQVPSDVRVRPDADAPNLEVRGNDDVFQHKLRSIEAYRSQLQIASLVDSIRQDGPYEYLRDVHFRLYSSKKYRPLFAD
ncbi:MAG: hypothetical protein NT013_06260 [Planctomycetia bacterium]|nr:hypothetical protein [Planctomycetia bacterium]